MKLEKRTFDQLKPGDLFVYPTEHESAAVQVRTDTVNEDEGNPRVLRIVPDHDLDDIRALKEKR
jgi:hypothetical protein